MCGKSKQRHLESGGSIEPVLFSQPLLFGRTPVMTHGAWTAEDVFTMVVRLVETPFYHTLICYFAGDGILIDIRINVSLESMEPIVLLGYPA